MPLFAFSLAQKTIWQPLRQTLLKNRAHGWCQLEFILWFAWLSVEGFLPYCSPACPSPPPPLLLTTWNGRLCQPRAEPSLAFTTPLGCVWFCFLSLPPCACVSHPKCLCLHMFNCQLTPSPTLPSCHPFGTPPQCHATILLRCGCNLNFSLTHTQDTGERCRSFQT